MLGRLGDGGHIAPLISDVETQRPKKRIGGRVSATGILFFNQQQKERRGEVSWEKMGGIRRREPTVMVCCWGFG